MHIAPSQRPKTSAPAESWAVPAPTSLALMLLHSPRHEILYLLSSVLRPMFKESPSRTKRSHRAHYINVILIRKMEGLKKEFQHKQQCLRTDRSRRYDSLRSLNNIMDCSILGTVERPDMMSASGRGGHGKAEIVREAA